MEFRKVLLIKLRAMGDTVIMTSSLNALRQQLPENSEIHCLASEPWSVLLENHPAIDRLFHWSKKQKIVNLLDWGWRLRREKYDAVFALHAAGTTAWLARLSGAPLRAVHFHGIDHANRFSTVEIAGKGEVKPIIQRDLDTLRAAGISVQDSSTSVHLTAEEQNWAENYLQRMAQPLLVLALGASRPTKIWPPERFRQLAERWIPERGGSVMVLIGPGEEALAESFVAMPGVHIRQGGSLRENAALIQKAKLFVGNDSGPKHLAVALGVKTITLFGPESPFEWHPYDRVKHPIAYVADLPCRRSLAPGLPEWCAVRECVSENHRCMKEIAVEDIVRLW